MALIYDHPKWFDSEFDLGDEVQRFPVRSTDGRIIAVATYKRRYKHTTKRLRTYSEDSKVFLREINEMGTHLKPGWKPFDERLTHVTVIYGPHGDVEIVANYEENDPQWTRIGVDKSRPASVI